MIEKMGKVVANYLVKLAKHPNLAGKWPGCILEHKMIELIMEFVQDRKARQIRLAQDAYEREKYLPVVLNTQAYEEKTVKELANIQELRYVARAKVLARDDISSHSSQAKREALEASMMDTINKKDSPYRKRVGPEPYARELEVMADMRAFYSYSAWRYVENIMQLVETGLLSKFDDLKVRMQNEFRYDDEEAGESNLLNEL
jgi:hypothetical protein